jgi:hypothetical protein
MRYGPVYCHCGDLTGEGGCEGLQTRGERQRDAERQARHKQLRMGAELLLTKGNAETVRKRAALQTSITNLTQRLREMTRSMETLEVNLAL